MSKRITNAEITAFFNAAVLLEIDECIEWPYALSNGYGILVVNGVNRRVTRLALSLRVKPPEEKQFALHRPKVCHNSKCFNYRHLYWGNQYNNTSDQAQDGTDNRGERNGQSKLTLKDVAGIKSDQRKQVTIAAEYGIAKSTVSSIKSGNRWAHVTD